MNDVFIFWRGVDEKNRALYKWDLAQTLFVQNLLSINSSAWVNEYMTYRSAVVVRV